VPRALPLIEDSIPALRRYARALLGNRDDADDLVHDTLVRALDTVDRRREDANVRAWLFAIMHTLFNSRHRRRKARPDLEPLDDSLAGSVSLRPDQEDRLYHRDLLRGLARLPEDQRSAVLLVSVEDLSYAEAAAVLGVPVGTVMSRLARGREKLRSLTEAEARPPLRRIK
jgi:RNA polymerase sigma-70 factor (ECF subfamily)